jgi:hypothetical protein
MLERGPRCGELAAALAGQGEAQCRARHPPTKNNTPSLPKFLSLLKKQKKHETSTSGFKLSGFKTSFHKSELFGYRSKEMEQQYVKLFDYVTWVSTYLDILDFQNAL